MEHSNVLTVAWTGTICTDPAMTYISIRPERYSYNIIKENMEFVINLTTKDLVRATDWCGVKSGREVDKFKEMGLTKEEAVNVKCPLIKESPVCIECKVKEIKDRVKARSVIKDILSKNEDLDKRVKYGRYTIDNLLNTNTKAQYPHQNLLLYSMSPHRSEALQN